MRTINISERLYVKGNQQTSRINLQPGEQTLNINMTTPGWLPVSEGTITLRFLVDRNDGQGPKQEWFDTFQKVILLKGGVPQTSLNFESRIQSPFQAGNDFIVQKEADVDVLTAITVNIS